MRTDRKLKMLEPWAGPVGVYLVIALLVTLPGLGSTGVVMMEGMVVDTAETMVATGDFIVPRLYGEIYSYKPPLLYWTTALAMQAAGRTEWALRFPAALSGIALGLFLLVLVGKLTRPRTGLFAALAAVTGVLFVQKMKIAEFDAPLAAATGIAVTAACYNLAADRRRRSAWIWLLGYLALACAFLIKGVPALMAYLPGLLVAAVVTRQWRQLVRPAHVASALGAAAIVGWYLWTAFSSAGPAIFEQPLAEAHTRGFEWSLASLGRTMAKPLIVWVVFLPWSLAWLWSFGRRRSGSSSPAEERLMGAGRAFLGAGLIAFMAVPTAQTRYYLPLAAGGAIVSALALERLPSSGEARRPAALLAVLSALAAIALSLVPHFAVGAQAAVLVLGLTALGAIYGSLRLAGSRAVGRLLLIAALCGWAMDTWLVRPRRAATRDLSPVARTLDRELPPEATVWTLGKADEAGKNGSLFYYLERSVRTFEVDRLPETGSFLLLTARDLARLSCVTPAAVSRIRLVRGVDHPRGRFLLYRVSNEPSRASKAWRSAPNRRVRERSASVGIAGG